MEMEERSRRIVETAIELAEQGGFEAVRLRDVASHAGVALGTLYRRFRSKEDLLVAALDQETEGLEERVTARPPKGDTPLERLDSFFTLMTRAFCRRPNLARALLKSMTSGNPELAQKVASFQARITRMIVVSLRGKALDGEPPSDEEARLGWNMQLIWFAMIISWSAGLHSQASVAENTKAAAELLLAGADNLS